MQDEMMNASRTEALPLTVEVDWGQAEVARALLAQPKWGIRSLTYVGLSAREAVHLVVAARCMGLEPRLSRVSEGQMAVCLVALDADVVILDPMPAAAIPQADRQGARAAWRSRGWRGGCWLPRRIARWMMRQG